MTFCCCCGKCRKLACQAKQTNSRWVLQPCQAPGASPCSAWTHLVASDACFGTNQSFRSALQEFDWFVAALWRALGQGSSSQIPAVLAALTQAQVSCNRLRLEEPT